MKTVYVDILLGVNIFVNYFILLLTSKLTGSNSKRFRLIIGSCVASVFSLIIFLPKVHIILSLIFDFLISIIVVLCTFGFNNIKAFIGKTLGFYSATFAYAGVASAIWFIFKPNGLVINNGVVYFNISPILLLLTTVISYFILLVLKKYFAPDKDKKNIYQLEISLENNNLKINGFLDTGNKLCDLFSDSPVVVVEYSKAKALLSSMLINKEINDFNFENIDDEVLKKRLRYIPYSVIGSNGILPAFRVDKVLITFSNKKIKQTDDCIVAVCNEDFCNGYSAVFGENLLQNLKERKKQNNVGIIKKDI